MKSTQEIELLNDYENVNNLFNSLFPGHDEMPVDFFVAHSTYTMQDIKEIVGSYSKLVKAYNSRNKKTRDSFNIHKNDQEKAYPRKYVVTSAIAGATLQQTFFETLQTICKDQKATLVILPMRGIHSNDAEFDNEILQHSDYFCTEYVFNKNLKAQDFKLNPQMIDPVTGILRMGKQHQSLIIAAPKHRMKSVPVGAGHKPHIVHTTGTITIPEYANNRQGSLAAQDHVTGALLVEVHSQDTFNIRQLRATADQGVYDLNKYYFKKTIKASQASGFVMGDLHCGSEDPSAIKAWKECIDLVKPKYIVMHDILDCKTINHHQSNNVVYKANLPSKLKTLKQELDLVADTLTGWCKTYNKSTFIITKGNHDAWLDNFLKEVHYGRRENFDNLRISLPLAIDYMDGKNPLKEYVSRYAPLKNIVWLDVDSDFKIEGVQCGSHGACGNNGGKASIQSIELQFGNSISGHAHGPEILRDTWIVGTSTYLKLDYNKGGGSSWLHASAIIHPGGTRQMIISIEGIWRSAN